MEIREIILAVVALLVLYLAWLAVRLWLTVRRTRRTKGQGVALDDTLSGNDTIQSRILGGDLGNNSSSVVFNSALEPARLPEIRLDESDRRVRPPAEPDAGKFGFDALLEVRQTRHLLDEVRQQQAALADEVAQLRKQVSEMRAASLVSPLYGEAVGLARRGYDAQAIAERCGISVSEAELVRALSAETPDTEG